MNVAQFKQDLVDAIPRLRAFARSISGDRDRADDLVQETLAKAIANKDKFTEGTNLTAWLITILRNQYYSVGRKMQREVSDPDGEHAATLESKPQQTGHLELKDFLSALQVLADDQREALILIGASGFSYEEAAEILGVKVGTVKSRVSRARLRLEELMNGTEQFERSEIAAAASASLIRDALTV
ncbi:sigma-70 family RNA polymerase sigma factor [Stappia sp. BW2]|jgi:RNA polymerase sigma-70 factor (ECF subfamily)|uniref:sigma-70 family RNA polymerase sigma factor n=1 Tax=Stappia sp. BW2 TaxID=2592622 RepID=UPI0011DEF14F|nr:sigma-70 family RNA polymerase sigma factor [Stappia sp. BW2]TYC78025.1 sigma-70 family RNA polymerase sigma factor [Stappia sp. BW2]